MEAEHWTQIIGYLAAVIGGGVGLELIKTAKSAWMSRQEAIRKKESRPARLERLLNEWVIDAYHARRLAAKYGAPPEELGDPPESPPKN